MPILSLRAYARHRGCALKAVQRAIADGRVPGDCVIRDTDGTLRGVDVERADAAWRERTDPVQSARAGHDVDAPARAARAERELLSRAPTPPGDDADTPAAPAGDSGPQYGAARALTEHYKAERARLDFLERIAALVPAADVESAAFTAARQVRDAILAVPDRICAQLAAESDPARIAYLLTIELRGAMRELVDRPESEAP